MNFKELIGLDFVPGDVLDAARMVLDSLGDGIPEPYAVPMSRGRMQFEWHKDRGRKSLELEIETPAQIHYLKWDTTKNIEEEDIFPIGDTERIWSLMQWFLNS